MINVAKPFLPPINEYHKYLMRIWETGQLTNYGPLVAELEKQLEEYLKIEFVQFVSNGTTALQMAIKALGLSGEIITTAFSHVSTVNAILWTNCQPVLIDINKTDFCIDADKIERAITAETSAILATHVFGNPCDVVKIEKIAKANNLKVIYDAAHAFGVDINKQSVFNYGDISAVSFHATKLFHTVEGGAVITRDPDLAEKCRIIGISGLQQGSPKLLGINAKNSEFHAAVGLCTLHDVPSFIKKRKLLYECYQEHLLMLNLQYQQLALNTDHNYSYFPVVFSSEQTLLSVMAALEESDVYPRRYFNPSLSNLPFYKQFDCPVADDISKRILCLPLYFELSLEEVAFISELILSVMTSLAPPGSLTVE